VRPCSNLSAMKHEPFLIELPDEGATQSLGQSIAYALIERVLIGSVKTGVTLSLAGDLGAGKTTLARAILRGLGVTGRIKSPTYAICEPYELTEQLATWKSNLLKKVATPVELNLISSLYLYHFDFYRFTDSAQWTSGGFSEYFSSHDIRIVEWAERVLNCADGSANAAPFVPDLLISIQANSIQANSIQPNETQRSISLQAQTTVGMNLLQQIQN
jgi:tRNA threonylcarbamoyladenosine biosynthesis protein TsaE